MQKGENLFQVFSQIFIDSQQSFNRCETELRNRCRVMAQKLNLVVEDLEEDVFNANISKILDLEEEMITIIKSAHELENRRDLIKSSVGDLKKSTQKHVGRKL